MLNRTEPLLVTRFHTPVKANIIISNDKLALVWREISSMDQLVKLRLPSHLQTFQVSFPCRIMEVDPTDKSQFSYSMITQTHPTLDPPKCWIYPLLWALRTIDSITEPDTKAALEYLTDHLSSLANSFSLLEPLTKIQRQLDYNENSIKAHEFDMMPIVVLAKSYMTIRLPIFDEAAYLPSHSKNVSFRGHANLGTFSKAEEIKAVECEFGLFRAIIVNFDTVEIQITLSDDSIIRTTPDFKFLKMWLDGSWVEEMYLVEMATEMGTFTNHYTGAIYPMREIVTTALSLYQNVHSNMKNDYEIQYHSPTYSSVIKQSMSIPDVGDFKYYIDGRCKCRFHDRTIIEFSSGNIRNGLASILDQSGNKLKIRISNPVGYEEHVNAMLDFISFVTDPQEKRTESITKKQQIIDELLTQRTKSLKHSQKLNKLLQNL